MVFRRKIKTEELKVIQGEEEPIEPKKPSYEQALKKPVEPDVLGEVRNLLGELFDSNQTEENAKRCKRIDEIVVELLK